MLGRLTVRETITVAASLKLDPANASIPPRMSLLREMSDPSSRYRTNP
jgi:hypothetical protein